MLAAFRTIGLVLAHFLLSTVGVAVCSVAGLYILKPALLAIISEQSLKRDAPLILPFFPIQSGIALASGFVIARSHFRFGKGVIADLVWIISLVWVLIAMLSWSHNATILESSWRHFFVSNDPESKRNQLIFTLPFLTSLFYGIGHYIGRRFQTVARHIDQTSR
jgi:hypothetical protein